MDNKIGIPCHFHVAKCYSLGLFSAIYKDKSLFVVLVTFLMLCSNTITKATYKIRIYVRYGRELGRMQADKHGAGTVPEAVTWESPRLLKTHTSKVSSTGDRGFKSVSSSWRSLSFKAPRLFCSTTRQVRHWTTTIVRWPLRDRGPCYVFSMVGFPSMDWL